MLEAVRVFTEEACRNRGTQRAAKVNVYLTPDEMKAIKMAATALGITVGEWLWRCHCRAVRA